MDGERGGWIDVKELDAGFSWGFLVGCALLLLEVLLDRFLWRLLFLDWGCSFTVLDAIVVCLLSGSSSTRGRFCFGFDLDVDV
jgi:hypothetical protein